MLSLLPSFAELVYDTWWEVQAQLLLLASQLLVYLASIQRTGGEGPSPEDDMAEALLRIVFRVFGAPGASKILLQVGLCTLVRTLDLYPSLLHVYVTVLLQQPPSFRQRLLSGPPRAELGAAPAVNRRLAYVMGTSSREYNECCICNYWPAKDVARALAEQSEAAELANFEPEHLEVLTACLQDVDVELDDDWLAVFEKVKAYVFVALIDPTLHNGATEVVKRFWLCRPQSSAIRALDASQKTLLQTLRILYGDTDQTRVDESDMLSFLREMREAGGAIKDMLQLVVDQFREVHNMEFQRSSLDTLFE